MTHSRSMSHSTRRVVNPGLLEPSADDELVEISDEVRQEIDRYTESRPELAELLEAVLEQTVSQCGCSPSEGAELWQRIYDDEWGESTTWSFLGMARRTREKIVEARVRNRKEVTGE